MANPMIQIGEEVREMTASEHAAHLQLVEELDRIEKSREDAKLRRESMRAVAFAKLAAIGLTNEEIASIVGSEE